MANQEKNNILECVICGNRDFILILKARDYVSFSPVDFNFMKCTRCEEVSVIPQLSGQYTHSESSYKKLGKTDAWHFLHPNRPKKIRKIKKSGRILDIGCGLGEFLFEMKTLGWEVYGNDIISDACRYAKEEFRLENIYNKDLLSLDFSDNFFDVITLWHVFGYLEKPLESFKKIKNILKDDGVLIIESPDFNSFQRKIFKNKWFGLALPNYSHHYSLKSLENALKHSGLKIVKKDYFVNLRIDLVSFKESLLRLLRLERVPDEKSNNETAFLKWLKRYKLIFIFEIVCFIIVCLLALVNCGTCYRVYCKKIEKAQKSKTKNLPWASMLIKKTKVALGIIMRKVITGPIEISIDITNRCGLGCITCWFYSPLKKDKIDLSWANQEMDFNLFKKIVNEAKDLEVEKIMVGAE
ncbi:MAG: methyltransferase domain-containing protein, partial [Candidatus Omnitrophica bacterium]|nr:methyltransferase domain-containing protein [Candidatus Omnitrophota bacterium]